MTAALIMQVVPGPSTAKCGDQVRSWRGAPGGGVVGARAQACNAASIRGRISATAWQAEARFGRRLVELGAAPRDPQQFTGDP
jgi:hypothetical protein